MLEDHVIDFIRKWGLGIGIYSEQGGESIHAEFNNLNRQFYNLHGTQKVHSMMKEHYLRNNPVVKNLKPVVKKRRKKDKIE